MNVLEFGSRSRTHSSLPGRYQLDVIACDVGDLVRSAGGWLFDRAAAGWNVNVVLSGECDLRPLEILGLNTEPREEDTDESAPVVARTCAVSADAFAADTELRADVLDAMKLGTADVLLWSDGWPRSMVRRTDLLDHELTIAARAFKRHALAAAGLSETVNPTETFRGWTSRLTGYSDLMPSVSTSLAHS